jgi:hypothetical protein
MTDRLLTIYVTFLAGVPALLTVFISLLIMWRQGRTTEKIVEVHDMVNGRLTQLITSMKSQAAAQQELHGVLEHAAGVTEGVSKSENVHSPGTRRG